MPYSAADVSSLPSNVQSLPADRRRQWAAVWNAAYANCVSPRRGGGPGSPKDCEGVAFRMANGVIAKAAKEQTPPEYSPIYNHPSLQLAAVRSPIQDPLWGGRADEGGFGISNWEKEGRVLSAANMAALISAMKAMLEVMRRAGFEMEGSKGGPGSGPHRKGGLSGVAGLNKAAVRLEYARTWLTANGHRKLAGRVDKVLMKITKQRMAMAA